MTKKNEVYFDPTTKAFIINGKMFKVSKITTKKKSDHYSKDIMVEVDKKEYDNRISEIISYLEETFDERKFLKSLLEGLPLNDIEKIERRMKKKAAVKEKPGCYNLMVGDLEIQMIE